MTTLSGTSNFQLTRNQLITATLRTMHVIGRGQLPTADDFIDSAVALNIMIKAWHTMGMQLWTIDEFTITPVVDRQSYTLGPGGGTVVSATVIAGSTDYTVAPTVTFSAPGGGGTTALGTAVLSSGAPGGIAITITNAGSRYTSPPTATLTGGTGGTGVTAISNLNGLFMLRPLRLLDDAFLRSLTDDHDSPLTQIDRVSYQRLGIKTSSSQPHEFYYDPQLDNGLLFIYPVASAARTYTLHFSQQKPLQDIDLSTENADFPQEWFQALKWSLADELSDDYGLSEAAIARISSKANLYRKAMSEWDGAQDNTSVFFGVANEGNTSGGAGGR